MKILAGALAVVLMIILIADGQTKSDAVQATTDGVEVVDEAVLQEAANTSKDLTKHADGGVDWFLELGKEAPEAAK